MTDFYTGEDYPWMCEKCQKAVNSAAMVIMEGIADDRYNHEEGPMDLAYDQGWFCGGRICIEGG